MKYVLHLLDTLTACRWSLLPRAWCAGCHRGQHDRERRRLER